MATPRSSTLALVRLGSVLTVTVLQFNTLLGVEPGSPWRWIFPVSYLVVLLAGVLWALILRARRPDVYLAIGLGAHAATTVGPVTPATYVRA